MSDVHGVFHSIRLRIARSVSKIVPPHEVEDIVQETYVRLCHVESAEQIEYPKSFLFKMARNLALDSAKRAERRLSVRWDDSTVEESAHRGRDFDETFERAASNEEFGHFCEAVRALPLQARRVFVLKKVYGYSQREIANELEIAESTVEKHIALAVRRCAAFLEEKARPQPQLRPVENSHE